MEVKGLSELMLIDSNSLDALVALSTEMNDGDDGDGEKNLGGDD